MALDPSIALAVRVAPFDVRIPTPIDRYTRLLQVQQMTGQAEAQRQLAESRRFALEQSRLEAQREEENRQRMLTGKPLSATEAYGRLGATGGAKYLEQQQKADTARLETEEKQRGALTSIAGGILQANSQQGFERGVMDAMARGVIGQDEGHELIGMPWNEQTRAQVQQIYTRGIEGEAQSRTRIAEAQEARAAEAAKTQQQVAGLDLRQKQRTADANRLAAIIDRDPELFKTELAALPPERQQPFLGAKTGRDVMRAALTPSEYAADVRATETAQRAEQTQRETERHHRRVEDLRAQGVSATAANAQATREQREETRAQTIGTNWQQSSKLVERWRNISNRYESVKAAIDRGGGPGDLAVIYDFAKVTDPESVVRESEVANAMKTGNIFAGYLARFNGLWNPQGGFLSPQVKEDFMNTIRDRMGITRGQVLKEYDEIARQQEDISPGSSSALFDPSIFDPEDTPTQVKIGGRTVEFPSAGAARAAQRKYQSMQKGRR